MARPLERFQACNSRKTDVASARFRPTGRNYRAAAARSKPRKAKDVRPKAQALAPEFEPIPWADARKVKPIISKSTDRATCGTTPVGGDA